MSVENDQWLIALGMPKDYFLPLERIPTSPSSSNGTVPLQALDTATAKETSSTTSTPRVTVTAQENDRLAHLDPEKLRTTDLTQRNPNELFTDGYMTELTKIPPIEGADTAELKDVMRKLAKGADGADRDKLIKKLAGIRDVDPRKLDAEYGRFLILKKQQEAVQKDKAQNGTDLKPVPDLNETAYDVLLGSDPFRPAWLVPPLAPALAHDEFMGSSPQLKFGKVIGDAFGVDPVFGALLSPTGGMVGPGNEAVQLDDDDPTGYHGIVHDAAGYLKNYHNQGPGYNYLGLENQRDSANPLTGQQSGMAYWHDKLDPGENTELMKGVIDVVAYSCLDQDWDKAGDSAGKVVNIIKTKVDRSLEKARQTVEDAIDSAMTAATDKAIAAGTALQKAAKEVASSAAAAADRVADTAAVAFDSAKEAVGAVSDAVGEKLAAAWDDIWS